MILVPEIRYIYSTTFMATTSTKPFGKHISLPLRTFSKFSIHSSPTIISIRQNRGIIYTIGRNIISTSSIKPINNSHTTSSRSRIEARIKLGPHAPEQTDLDSTLLQTSVVFLFTPPNQYSFLSRSPATIIEQFNSVRIVSFTRRTNRVNARVESVPSCAARGILLFFRQKNHMSQQLHSG
jgi:hypothetical protein